MRKEKEMAQGIKNTIADFWKYVRKDGPIPTHRPDLGPCWTWLGTIDKSTGYAVFSAGGLKFGAHRLSYEITKGPIPAGLTLERIGE